MHHNNALDHALFVIFLAKIKTVVTPQPPYSPDMALSEFFLFSGLKRTIDSIKEMKTESPKELNGIPKTEFHNYFRD